MVNYPPREYTDAEFQAEFFETCLVSGEFIYSNGDFANHKVMVGNVQRKPELEDELLSRLGGLVMAKEPDFVVGVPNGGTWLAEKISQRTGISLVRLKDSDDQKSMELEDDFIDGECTLGANLINNGVLIEDTFRTFKKTRMAMAVPALWGRITDAVAVIDRGNPATRQPLYIPNSAVITEHIPAMLTSSHEMGIYLN